MSRTLTPNQKFLRKAILSGDTHSPAVAYAYKLERQAMRLEEALPPRPPRRPHPPIPPHRMTPSTPSMPSTPSTPSIPSTIAALEQRLAAIEARLDLFPEHPTVAEADAGAIIRTVSNYYGVPPAKLLSPARDYEIAWPRQVAMFLLKSRTLLNYSKIGRLLHRDHGTILWGIKTVQDRMADPRIKAQIDYLLAITARGNQSEIPGAAPSHSPSEISNVKSEILPPSNNANPI